jgi:hypothetical protein
VIIEPKKVRGIKSKTKNSNNNSISMFGISRFCKKRDYFCKNQQNFIKTAGAKLKKGIRIFKFTPINQ